MELRDLIRDFRFTLRDLTLTGMLVSPVWLALGLFAGDVVMIVAAIAVAVVSTLHVKPALVARLRDA
ncbi:MAG TPA: hypothetical protein VGF46_13610 [Gaiellales bacterium]|jgi:hypothetical protein